MAEHFTRFAREKYAKKHSKNSTNIAELNNSLSPKIADKQAIEDKLNIDGNKHVLACF